MTRNSQYEDVLVFSPKLDLTLKRNNVLLSEDVPDIDAHVYYLDTQKRAMQRSSQLQECLYISVCL